MKKFILTALLAITGYFVFCQAPSQVAPPTAADTVAPAKVGLLAATLPDTLHFEYEGQEITIATADGKYIVTQIKEAIATNKGKPITEWLIYIVTYLLSAGGLTFITSVRRFSGQIIAFVGKTKQPLNVLVSASAAVSAGLTYIFQGGWDTTFFLGTTGVLFMIAVNIYERFWKKKKTKTAPAAPSA